MRLAPSGIGSIIVTCQRFLCPRTVELVPASTTATFAALVLLGFTLTAADPSSESPTPIAALPQYPGGFDVATRFECQDTCVQLA